MGIFKVMVDDDGCILPKTLSIKSFRSVY